MDQLLDRLTTRQPDESPVAALTALLAQLRPDDAGDFVQATSNLRALTYLLGRNAEHRAGLRRALIDLMAQSRQVQLYTDTGLLSNETFAQVIKRRIGERLLPPARSSSHLADQFGLIFSGKKDYRWVASVETAVWQQLWQALAWQEETAAAANPTRLQLLEAVQVLTARISAIGLEPELVRVYPDIERFESPFLHLSAEALQFVESARAAMTDPALQAEDDRQMLVLLEQCEQLISRLRKVAGESGVSISLTYHLLRLEQHIERLRSVLRLLDPGLGPATDGTLFTLLAELVRAENRKYSVRDVFTGTTELLARQVTEHAGRHGEHYIAENRSEWKDMARAAMGAGLIVGFMALFKLLLAKLHLPLIWEALAFGLNYALGFMLIHVLHFTVATKQPAMTAARIAAVIHQGNGKPHMRELAELVAKVARTQLVAILGNVLVAIPVAWLIAVGWKAVTGAPVIDVAKAGHLLADQNPVGSLALLHAAIAGVYLFLAGLIAGYYDNKAIYRQIPQRLAALPWLNRLLGEKRTRRLAHYVEHNLGGLAGNFYFGMLLGITGTVGFLLGLPLDIRHITFSSAYLSYAAVSYDYQMPLQLILPAVGGVVLIGMTNLLVSFNLALWVALRSRKLRGHDALPLLPAVLKLAISKPRDFLIPPPQRHDP
ncbi:site-specific recombinase [Vogesella sp. LIG4]|uniref:site-specific recombinase n=1 Tax=Vogesella sp. LIG4 TaxID=1192162 RepID=UPI00081FBAA7|nr:site-specific recombinase [Vogesella sp. LIG4]SCK27364.1 Site-specific recombinase [Vogesella sp. LIG4]